MLDERKAAILRAVVEEYIETADPVGSARVARAAGVGVSSATVRNEMAVLEREGYLTQPHTSAGRIPTDKGYRFFVDAVMEVGAPRGELDAGRNRTINDFFGRAHGQLEQMLQDTSRLLAHLTHYAAVVVAPSHEVATIRSVQVVGLAPRIALVVVVLSNGVIDKRRVDLASDTTDDRLARVTAHLAEHLLGTSLAADVVVPALPDADDQAVAAAVHAALHDPGDDEADHVYVGGVSRMTEAFDAVSTVSQILGTLEQQFVVVTLLRDLIDRGLSVAIGAEHGLQPLAECSVIVAPYEVDGEPQGSIGVLGPTRMHYPEALATVAVVSQQLGKRLSEG